MQSMDSWRIFHLWYAYSLHSYEYEKMKRGLLSQVSFKQAPLNGYMAYNSTPHQCRNLTIRTFSNVKNVDVKTQIQLN